MSDYREWVTGKADYTGDAQLAHAEHDETLHLLADGDFGSGKVAIELENPDGGFRSFPETEVVSPGGQQIFLSAGQRWRLAVSGCTSVNVEVR